MVDVRQIDPDLYQWQFYTALNRYPSMVAGWGTGKTMWALLKGDLLSRFYRNNLGLVIRKKATDLRDSTIKDFAEYTGKRVPQNTREAVYNNGSGIIFKHADELSGIQNINIGWGYMEQAEELPTDSQFQFLRGRLRRDLKVDENYWSLLVKGYGSEEAVPEFLKKMREEPLNQIMVIANANGHNWCWKKFIKSPAEEFSCIQATSFDNSWLMKNKPKTIIDWRRMEVDSPDKFKRLIMNDHSEVDLESCYYGSALNELRRNGHIGNVYHNPAQRVYLGLDVGFDCTSIWLFQVIGQGVYILNYYENTGKPASFYASILDSRKKEYGYNYGRMFLPHDSKKRESSNTSWFKSFKDLGYEVIPLKKETNVDFGISGVINILPRCWFDETKCADGLEGLNHYHREYNDELKIYLETPLHDWASHPADGFRYVCRAIESGLCGTSAAVSMGDIKKWREKYRRVG